MSCVREKTQDKSAKNGVWLSLARALDLGSRGRRFESCHPDFAGVVQWQNTSLPSWIRGFDSHHPLSICQFGECEQMCSQLSWIEQRPSKPWVGGSNPFEHISFLGIRRHKDLGIGNRVACSLLWWVQRSWLARQIVALEAQGSNPCIHPYNKALVLLLKCCDRCSKFLCWAIAKR